MKTITRIQTVLFGFILSSFMCAVCSAEVVSYRAVSVSNLNVREQPSVQSEKIGTITKSDTVIVESVEDAWAKINFNGKVAYVNANYLEEVEVGNLAEKDENLSFLKNILPLPLYGERWTWIVNANVAMTFVWAIFILSCFLLWVHRVRGNWLEGWRYKLNIVVFLSLSIIEVVYMAGHGDQALWFYGYAGYGALGMFVYLILYILVALICINQWTSFTATLDDIQLVHSIGSGGRRIGVYSMPLCLLGYMASRLFWHPGMALSLGLLLVLQGLQIFLMVKSFVRRGSLRAGLLWSMVYLVGIVGMIYMFTNIIGLFALLLCCLLVIGIIEIVHYGLGLGNYVSFGVKDRYGKKEQTFVHKGKLICRNCAYYSSLQSSCFAGETPKKVHGFDSCDRFRLSVDAEIEDLSGKKIKVKR